MFHVCLILVSPVKSGNSANGGEQERGEDGEGEEEHKVNAIGRSVGRYYL